jgi:hypothetical protein
MQQYLIPNERLKKLLTLLKIIGFINFGVAFLRIINQDFFSLMFDLINVFILYMAYSSVFFMCMAMYIIFSFMRCFYLFLDLAIFVQSNIMGYPNQNSDYVSFGVNLFIFFFYCTAIFFTFKIYKEMKAQFYERYSSGFQGKYIFKYKFSIEEIIITIIIDKKGIIMI